MYVTIELYQQNDINLYTNYVLKIIKKKKKNLIKCWEWALSDMTT